MEAAGTERSEAHGLSSPPSPGSCAKVEGWLANRSSLTSARERRLVEAAGVEPASESTSSQDSTCVSASGFSCPACGSGEVPPGLSPGESRRHAPRRHVPTSLFNGVRPPATRRGQGERHCLIKQRERTDCPQLTDVPSDLRVNGARHASRNPVPPSKPNSPPAEVCGDGADALGPVHDIVRQFVTVARGRGDPPQARIAPRWGPRTSAASSGSRSGSTACRSGRAGAHSRRPGRR